MAHLFDPVALAGDVLKALSDLLQADVKVHADFAERQARALAKQAAWIAEATANREIEDADRDWLLADLATLSENFARVLAGLTILTVEKAWNAIVSTIWGAINGAVKAAIGITLPLPSLSGP